MTRRSAKIGAWMVSLLLVASACGSSDIAPGSQLIGQRCYRDADCREGLECSPRRLCVLAPPTTEPGSNSSANNPNNPNNANNGDPNGEPNNDDPNNDDPNIAPNGEPNIVPNGEPNNDDPNVNPNNDDPNNSVMICEPGERSCLSPGSYELCIRVQDGGTDFIERQCPEGTDCEAGRCREICRDADGDGAFANCDPFDCNDDTEARSPLNEESCGDGIDNNCNRQVDEGCMQQECCPDCVGINVFCTDCQCVPYDPAVCQFQNQPCTGIGMFSGAGGDLYCSDLAQSGGLGTCVRTCDSEAPDPDAQCGVGQVCALGANEDDTLNACFDACVGDADCGSPNSGCFPYNSDDPMSQGICTPADPNNPIGQPCDPDTDGLFGCEPSAVCIDATMGGGSECVEVCRPFLDAGQPGDCSAGTFCAGFGPDLGLCEPDNGQSEFDVCTQSPDLSACSEDDVLCFPIQMDESRCLRLCRLGPAGDQDCNPGTFCEEVFAPDADVEVGVCIPNG